MPTKHEDEEKSSTSLTPPTPQKKKKKNSQPSEARKSESGVLGKPTEDVSALFVLGRVLGKGQFGTTRLAEERSTGRQLACKSIAKRKLTTPEDFARAEARILSGLADVRVGQGFDVHAFAPGDHVWLGGVRVPHSRALAGHSDADVALHALTDAILGAIADGDIGSHFPPSDERWRGAASEIFLKEAVRLVVARGGAISHLDLTIVCEAPKVGPHRDAIRARIAEIAALPVGRVSVKATTTEKLGFTGRREGIAAMATATVRLPFPHD